MKKVLLIIAAIVIMALFSSCGELAGLATGFADGYDSGSRGYTFIGQYSSASACSKACSNRGGSSYEYNPSTTNCFCK